MEPNRIRVGLLVPRFTLFDPYMRDGFVERMRAAGARSQAVLEGWFDVTFPGVVENEEQAVRAGAELRAGDIDVLVVAPAMAAPPLLVERAVEQFDAPIVLWNSVQITRMAADLTQAEATEHSTTVGCTMIANALQRRGLPTPVVTTDPRDPASAGRLRRVVRAVSAAGQLRGAHMLRIGEPVHGYTNVAASVEDLQLLGVEQIAVSKGELDDAYEATTAADACEILEERHKAGWRGSGGPQAERSARLARAVGDLLDRTGALGGTVNCHGPLLRFSDRIGIVACLAVARETERGRPLSCTGDMPVAIALMLGRRIAGAALYSECYAPEPASGLMLVAAGGEGDPAWADPPGAVELEPCDHYPGHHGAGTSVSFALRRGPATILSLSPIRGRWRMAWATGEVVETRYSNLRGPNAMFRFDSGAASDAASAWIASGATHHQALVPGRIDRELDVVADVLGLDSRRV